MVGTMMGVVINGDAESATRWSFNNNARVLKKKMLTACGLTDSCKVLPIAVLLS